jgi:hypothetical protein
MIPFVQQPGDPIAAAVLTAIEQTGDQSTSALQTALAQAVGLTTTAAEKMDPVLEQVKQISIQVWDVGVGLNGTNGTSLKEILEPALELLKPVVAYVAKNPWVLIPILIPALDAWLLLVGFGVDGIVAGMSQHLVAVVNTKTNVHVKQALSRRGSKVVSATFRKDRSLRSFRATAPEDLHVPLSAWV